MQPQDRRVPPWQTALEAAAARTRLEPALLEVLRADPAAARGFIQGVVRADPRRHADLQPAIDAA